MAWRRILLAFSVLRRPSPISRSGPVSSPLPVRSATQAGRPPHVALQTLHARHRGRTGRRCRDARSTPKDSRRSAAWCRSAVPSLAADQVLGLRRHDHAPDRAQRLRLRGQHRRRVHLRPDHRSGQGPLLGELAVADRPSRCASSTSPSLPEVSGRRHALNVGVASAGAARRSPSERASEKVAS